MIRPGQSSLSLRSIGSSIKDLNTISSKDRLDEKIVLLMPSLAGMKSTETSNRSLASCSSDVQIYKSVSNDHMAKDENEIKLLAGENNNKITSEHDFNTTATNTTTPTTAAATNYYSNAENLTQVYFKRWIILFIFSFISLLSAFNWIEYNIIQDVTIAFYNESLPAGEVQQNDAVNWFSMVYMASYIPLVYPAMFLLDRKGLKLSCVLGALLTTIGSIVKCAAVSPNLFAVAMLGQTICAIAQAFTLSVPARLSALWFGPTEIATATSIGVFGNQLGSAIGFLVPPSVVTKSDSIEFMQKRFYYLLVPVATLSAISFILAFVFVKDQPDKPPSLAQLEIRNITTRYEASNEKKQSDIRLFINSLSNLLKNLNFDLILISYGINTGVYYAIGTLLNQIVSEFHHNENEKIGFIGLILVMSGLLGAMIGGIILDKTKAYKLTTLVMYICSLLAMILFAATLKINIWVIFGTSFLLGFFMTGYLPVGFELAAEVTYPEPESSSCGLLNSSAQIFGIFFIYVQGRLNVAHGAFAGNIFVIVSLTIGTFITALVKSDLRRQKAIKLFDTKDKDSPEANKPVFILKVDECSEPDKDLTETDKNVIIN